VKKRQPMDSNSTALLDYDVDVNDQTLVEIGEVRIDSKDD